MVQRILITFDFVPSGRLFPEEDLIHKIRNFGEDLLHEFSTSPMATIDINAVDRATNRLCVVVTRGRYKTRAVRLIEKVLSRHYLTDIAHISEEPVESPD